MTRRANRVWPASHVEMRQIDRIVPYPQNPRVHPPEQIERLAADMLADGVTMPILVDEDGVIIAGHGRLLAAAHNGFEKYPVVVARGWTETQKRSARLRDNQIGMLSSWDKALIQHEIAVLKADGFPILSLGFPEAQLRGWGVSVGTDGADPDEAPEPPKNPVVRLGDLWVLGDHRILCGDSTVAEDVAIVAGGKLAQMVFTDPPYGVAYRDTGAGAWDDDKKAKKRAGLLKPRFEAIESDDLNEDDLLAFLKAYMKVQPITKNAAQYICHANLRSHVFRAALLASGYIVRSACIWAKSRPGFNFAHYKWKHEPIFYAVPEKGKPVAWYGDQAQTTLWEVASESGAAYEHPTQKPVGLPVKAINNSSKAGDYIYEPFSGSGSTLIGCEMTGRRCIAIEKSPAYVQVAIARWEKFTNRKALLDGKTLDEVAKTRKGKSNGRSKDASRHPGKPVRGAGSDRDRQVPRLPRSRDAGLSATRREPTGVSRHVARDSE